MKDILKPNIYWLFAFVPVAIFLEHCHALAIHLCKNY